MSRGFRVTREEYKKIKLLSDSKLSQKMIAELTGRDPETIRLAQKTSSFDEYVQVRKEISAKHNKKVQKQNDALQIISGEEMNRNAAIRETINMINDIGLRFHKLAEYLFENFCRNEGEEEQ